MGATVGEIQEHVSGVQRHKRLFFAQDEGVTAEFSPPSSPANDELAKVKDDIGAIVAASAGVDSVAGSVSAESGSDAESVQSLDD